MGVYHLFHQCCQNHWDHVVSDDLVHWRRLPSPVRPSSNPKEWYDARGSYDGSLVVLPPDQGGRESSPDGVPVTPARLPPPRVASARSAPSSCGGAERTWTWCLN